MSDYTSSSSGGGGCLFWILFILGCLVVSAGMGDYESTGDRSRSGVLSGNQTEVLSRNQLNLWSEVENCYGDYSCMTVISTTSSNTDIATTAGGDVQYRDGGIVFGDGVLRCWDTTNGGYTAEACQAQGGQP